MPDTDPLLQYLLERIEKNQIEGFTRLETQLSQKADKSDVQRVEDRLDEAYTRLDSHQRDIEGLKAKEHDEAIQIQVIKTQKSKFRTRAYYVWSKLWYVVFTVALILATALSGYFGSHLHL